MKQLILEKPGELHLEYVEVPHAAPGELVVEIKAALTCGTDLKTYRRGHPKWPTPTPFGHEFSGTVSEVGEGVDAFSVGQDVMVAPTASCGHCRNCQRGYGNLCDYTMQTMMLGAYSEYIRVPAHIVKVNVYPKPSKLTFLQAAALEPLSCVVYGDEQLEHHQGETVVIIGAGPIGLLWVMVSKLHNVGRVIVAGRRQLRLNTAEKLGADVVIDTDKVDFSQEILRLTEGRGADVVVECTGSPDVWSKAINLTKRGGQVMLFGGCKQGTQAHIPMKRLLRDGISVKAAFHYTPAAAKHSQELLASGKLHVEHIVTEVLPLEEYKTIFKKLDNGEVIKIGVLPK